MSIFTVEVKSAEVTELKGISTRTGKDYLIRKQTAWIDLGKAYPEQIEVNLDRDQLPYQPGKYRLSPGSFYIDRNRQLSLRPILEAQISPKAA